jgi:hypothetical protein
MREWAARLPDANRMAEQLEQAGERMIAAMDVRSLIDLEIVRRA